MVALQHYLKNLLLGNGHDRYRNYPVMRAYGVYGKHHEPYRCLFLRIVDLHHMSLFLQHLVHDVVTSLMHQTTFG